MVWVRRLAAVATAAFFVLLFGGGILGLAGAISLPDSAPGISKADSEALAAPFADLMAGRDDVLSKRFVEGVDLSKADEAFDQMRAAVPSGAPASNRLIQWFVNFGPQGNALTGVHEKTYRDHVVRVQTQLFRPAETSPWKLANLDVRAVPVEALASNRFSLSDRSPIVVGFVFATFAVVLFSGVTAIACILMENVRMRWLWLPFTVVGLTTLRVDLNGGWAFQPISFQLFSAGFAWSGSAFQPWVFAISLPVGAVAFWVTHFLQKPPPGPQEIF